MFHSKQINHKKNKLHERALSIVFNDNFSSFEEPLSKDKSVTVHLSWKKSPNICYLYKILNGLSQDFMQDIFETKNNCCNTFNAPAFSSRNIKTVRYGLQIISYMAPKIWDLVPKEMRKACRLCRTHHPQIGFTT